MTHTECSKAAKVATPCAAWHITFGGRCLNCGFTPPSFPPEDCRDCGAPTNNAEGGRCAACRA